MQANSTTSPDVFSDLPIRTESPVRIAIAGNGESPLVPAIIDAYPLASFVGAFEKLPESHCRLLTVKGDPYSWWVQSALATHGPYDYVVSLDGKRDVREAMVACWETCGSRGGAVILLGIAESEREYWVRRGFKLKGDAMVRLT